ncbi:MAG TPA: DUF4340 domain-containing protein [Terracidiphilus sp.]|nr:DUF4340 domain-containing protein [Terracidiphilus sp.]
MKLGGRFPGLAIACLILAALSGFLYWSNRHPKSDEAVTPATPAAPTILNVDSGKVTGVTLKVKGQPGVTLAKQSGAWQITAPQSVAADQEQVSMLLSALAPLTAQEVVATSGQPGGGQSSELSRFGLDSPSMEVDIEQKGKPAQRLLFGDDTPVGGNAYAMLAGDPRIFTVSGDSKRQLDKTEMDLRDKRLITISSDKMTSIELNHGGQTIVLARTGSGWALEKPEAYRTDSIAADTLADTLAGAQMQTTQPDAKDAEAGFARGTPVATVKVTGPAGTQTLEVRKDKNGKNGAAEYAKSSVVAGIYQVDSSLGDGLDKTVDDFRNKQLFDFGDNDPDSIDLEGTDPKISLAAVHNAQGWWQNGKKADSDSIEAVVSGLRSLTATKFATAGFAAPVLAITVTSKDGKLVEKAEIARSGDNYLARRAGDPSLYVLDAGSIEGILTSAKAVKPAR